VIHNKAFRY